jgi:hypothetical protein
MVKVASNQYLSIYHPTPMPFAPKSVTTMFGNLDLISAATINALSRVR